MTAKVIQGFFLGGQPKLASVQPRIAAPPPIQAKTAAPSPATAFAGRPPGPPIPAFGARPLGPPAPAFAARPGAVQRHGAGGAFSVDSGALGLASGGGKPLPDAVRGQMEAALGADFSNVRVHVGPQAERIGAIAFTVGSDIYFAPGRYQPETVHGQQLLGHELAHVVQQRAGRVRNPLGSGLAVVQDHALEAEADRLGQHAAMHRVAAQAKMPSAAAQPSAPVRISPPISAGPGSYRLTAGAGGRQVGSVMVHARDKGAVEVTDLQVAEAQRGNGLGRMLLASAARTGQQFGRSKVTLAAQDNGSGHLTRWYKGMGFAQTGVNQRGYPQLEAPISRLLVGVAQRQVTNRVEVANFKSSGRDSEPTLTATAITSFRTGRTSIPRQRHLEGRRSPRVVVNPMRLVQRAKNENAPDSWESLELDTPPTLPVLNTVSNSLQVDPTEAALKTLAKRYKEAFYKTCEADGVDPGTVVAAIQRACTDPGARKTALTKFAEGAPLGKAIRWGQLEEQVTQLRYDTNNLVNIICEIIDEGFIGVKKITYCDNPRVAGSVYVFTFNGHDLIPEWHVHWGPGNKVLASSFKNVGKRNATGEGVRTATTPPEVQALQKRLKNIWGP